MADTTETVPPTTTEVDTTKQSTGTIRVGLKGAQNPTPTILARATKALRYFAVSLITMVSATDIFDGGQAKIINFSLGVFILATAAVDILIGVEPDSQTK